MREQLQLNLDVDGETHEVRDSGTLLDALREDAGKLCVKDGCAPQGQCGACSVLVDGEPRLACVTPVTRVAGRTVTTADGLGEPLRGRLGAAFCEAGGFVCGFCTPGIVVRAHALISSGAAVDRDSVGRALAANLCRCTGWQSVVDAVQLAAGTGTAAVSGADADVALGGHRFLADIAPDSADHWVVPVPAGVAAGTFVGVDGEGLVLAEDLADRAVEGWRLLRPGDSVRDAGDVAALARGDSLSTARDAAAAARVRVNPDAGSPSDGGDDTVWSNPPWDPAFLEPEAARARVDAGTVEVWSQTETPDEEARQLRLAWPDRDVELHNVTNGGSYGGKAGAGPAGLAALLAESLGGDVMVVLGRRESILWHRRRRPGRADLDLDVDVGGLLRRIDGVLVVAGGGADPGPNPYKCPAAVRVEVEPGRIAGAHRGDGHLQWTFALETEIERREVERRASLHDVPRVCLEALGDRDGVAVAGGSVTAVAAGVDLDADGHITAVVLVYGGAPDDRDTRNAVVSGAFTGLGCAIAEDLPMRDGVPTPATIRSIGMLRCAHTPPMEARCAVAGVEAGPWTVDEHALAAVPAAVANAVQRRFDLDARHMPMRDSPPARAARRR